MTQSEAALLLLQKGALVQKNDLFDCLKWGCSPRVIGAVSDKLNLPEAEKVVFVFQAYCRLGMKKEVQAALRAGSNIGLPA